MFMKLLNNSSTSKKIFHFMEYLQNLEFLNLLIINRLRIWHVIGYQAII